MEQLFDPFLYRVSGFCYYNNLISSESLSEMFFTSALATSYMTRVNFSNGTQLIFLRIIHVTA